VKTIRPTAVVFLFAACLMSQAVPPGYQATVQTLPSTASYPAALPNGTAWFDGSDVIWLENGQAPRSLLHFAAPRFGAFSLPLSSGSILFADSSLGEVWLLPTSLGRAPQLLGSLVLPYDAAQLSPTTVVVSAKLGGYGASDNDLVQIDLTTGATINLGHVPGASGAIAVDSQGQIVYATAPATYPPPAGSVQVLRWTAQQVLIAQLGALPLTQANAQVLASGIDAIGDLALDSDDDLFFIDWFNGRLGEINELNQGAWVESLVDYSVSNVSCGTLQFVGNAGQFEPWSTVGNGMLYIHETDYMQVSQLRAMSPRAAVVMPSVSGVIPRGPFTLQLQQGPQNGLGIFACALAPTRNLVPVGIAGFEQTLLWDTSLVVGTTLFTTLGNAGQAQINLANPGIPLGSQLVAAWAFTDNALRVIGASPITVLPLAP
jgi:hypothetical protein